MFEDILSKLNTKSKDVIGISLNASGLLEITQIDRGLHTVKKYTNGYVNYDPINREPASYSELEAQIENAMAEMNIAKNTNVTFSLPNVLFGLLTLPDGIDNNGITNSVIATAEDSYIFKREDPIVSWAKLSNNDGYQKIAYCAIQERVLTEIKDMCTRLNLNLVSVQNQYSTLLQGLDFCEITERYAINNTLPWNILYISATNYAIFTFQGDKLEDFYEEPLAIKSFSSNEVYAAVAAMAAPALARYQAPKTIIISATDEISAEIIAPQLGLIGDVEYYDQNKYQSRLNLDMSVSDVVEDLKSQISLLAVGSGADHLQEKYLKFNLAAQAGIKGLEKEDTITIGSLSFSLTPEKAAKFAVPIAVVFVAIALFSTKTLDEMVMKNGEALEALRQEETRLQSEMSKNKTKTPVVDVSASINEVVASNRKKLLYYDSLSYGIPPQLWIEYFYAGNGNAIGIYGSTTDSSSIAGFLRGIREVAGESSVSVTKLKIAGNDEIMAIDENAPDIYSFELSSPSFRPSLTSAISTDKKPQNGTLPPAGVPSKLPPLLRAN